MSKRRLIEQDPAFREDTKRAKLEEPSSTKIETITSARQLQGLLIFNQHALPQVRSGIQSFKSFLDSILYPVEPEAVPVKKAILREYLESQRPRDTTSKDYIFPQNLIETWSFSTQTNNDTLFSAAAAVIALLLKAISHELELKEYGLLTCHTILQIAQLKLVSRGLSAAKHKEHLISPCLRLLLEVVSFDGGAVAKQVYSKRDFTFDGKNLARNLGLLGKESSNERKRPSVRSNAVQYLLAHLKYQNEGPKIDILKQGQVLRALLENLKFDPPFLVKEIFNVLKNNVLQDANVPRSSKSYLLQDRNLTNIAILYKSQAPDSREMVGHERSVDDLAHEFLIHVCTTPGIGALAPSQGWYPPGADIEAVAEDSDSSGIDMGLDSVDWHSKGRGKASVRNMSLSNFIQGLRPYANIRERELLLAIFRAAPELVADYFNKKSNFSFEPKLTSTWMGYSAFLFSTVQLPVPSFFGVKGGFGRVPPPVTVAIESILPLPLNQKALTKALNSNSDLVTFFAVRLTVIAFQKLQKTLQLFNQASSSNGLLWAQAASKLLEEFCRRAPQMKDVILAFNRTSEDRLLEREAITRLLSLYYELTPHAALSERFDVAVPLTNSLLASERSELRDADSEMRLLELSHLVKVAQLSPNMRWWHKPDTLRNTPFVTLLKIFARSGNNVPTNILQLLDTVIREGFILQQTTQLTALNALLVSLQAENGCEHSESLFDFLDECLTRLVRRPIAYQDILDSTVQKDTGKLTDQLPEPVSLILAPLVEQWQFLVDNKREGYQHIAKWIQSFLHLLKHIGENGSVIEHILKKISPEVKKPHNFSGIELLLERTSTLHSDNDAGGPKQSEIPDLNGKPQRTVVNGSERNDMSIIDVEMPPEEDEKHLGLSKWMQKDVEEAIDDGLIEELVLCFCSKHKSIRLQATSSIRKFLVKGNSSGYPEWEQINLLLRELLETALPIIDTNSLSPIAGVFAARALRILSDPLHVLYSKLNRFLLRGPTWDISHLPSYWMQKIILEPPDDDDGFHKELEWLLEYLFDALRTPEDMEVYRSRNIFERVLALYNLASTPKDVQRLILKLCFRAIAVAGSTTLITRSGILSWIEEQSFFNGPNEPSLKHLAEKLCKTCDQVRVVDWSNRALST